MSAPTSLMTAGSFGKMPTTSARRLISRLSRSSGFVDAIWAQCSRGKAMYTSTSSREAHELGKLGEAFTQRIGDLSPLGMGRFGCVLGEDRFQQGYDRWALLRLHARQRIAHPMHPAALMRGMEDLRGRGPQALVVIGDDELHTPQAPIGERAQERRPEWLGF